MLHVLGIDEHLERAPMPSRDDVVDRDVKRMLRAGPFDLVGLSFQRRRAVERFRKINHFSSFGGGNACQFRSAIDQLMH